MGASTLSSIFLFLVVFFPSSEASFPSPESLIQQACFGAFDAEACRSRLRTDCDLGGRPGPYAVLHAAMQNTISDAIRAIELVTRFAAGDISGNTPTSSTSLFREQVAIRDCVELLDLSVEEMARSAVEISAMAAESPSSSDARRHGNVMAWISAALGNQDTCLEGFDGTDGRIRDRIKGSLTQVTELLANVMRIYKKMHTLAPLNLTASDPPWMSLEGGAAAFYLEPRRRRPDAVVSRDGTGDFRSIMEAVTRAPDRSSKLYVIYIKKGVYEEIVEVKKKKTRIALVGDGIGRTVITGNRSAVHGWTTFRTATLAAAGLGFIATDMTIRNTAGAENHQAAALRVDSDCSAFYRCSIEGHQDTLYAHSGRQFYRDCNIYGTLDFIFGNGNIVVQHSQIIARPPLPAQRFVTVTAQGRRSAESQTGFSIHGCSVLTRYPTYLGRPWKEFSTTVFMQTYMDAGVQPAGWVAWDGDFALGTLFYGEFGNYGPGSPTSERVKWPGFHVLDAAAARLFTVKNFIKGQFWLPATGVRFATGLL